MQRGWRFARMINLGLGSARFGIGRAWRGGEGTKKQVSGEVTGLLPISLTLLPPHFL